ncbi:PadR family transcriptional regulator [Paenibacillus sp. CAU 1782]
MKEEWREEERLFLHLGGERETSGSGRRYFSRGGVKFALLELLEGENMHGYQMMKALEEQSGGTYQPSAGSIYPTLQMLRDQGFVESSKQDGKRVFQITAEGRAYLSEEKEKAEGPHLCEGHCKPHNTNAGDAGDDNSGGVAEGEGERVGGKRNRRLTPKGKELLHLLKAAERSAIGDAGKAEELRVILQQLKKSLALLIEGSDTAPEGRGE